MKEYSVDMQSLNNRSMKSLCKEYKLLPETNCNGSDQRACHCMYNI